MSINSAIEKEENYSLICNDISKYYLHKPSFFSTTTEKLHVLDSISFKLERGKTLGLVGPSGCGKSTLARIISGLVPQSAGQVFIDNIEMKNFEDYIGKVQMVFQNPFSSLNPKLKVGYSIQEPLLVKNKRDNLSLSKQELQNSVEEILKKVGLEKDVVKKFPHEFSGGQRQRIAIARALITKPTLLICDEAVSALDVSIQAQILNLLKDIKEEENLSLVFISHDADVIELMSDDILRLEKKH